MSKENKHILMLAGFFGLYFLLNRLFFADIYYFINDIVNLYFISFLLAYIIVGIPLLGFVYTSNNKSILKPLGLEGNALKAVLYSFLFTIPMFAGSGIISGFSFGISGERFWFYCVFAAFFEELYYRGIFFGQLYRKTRLGFLPALFFSAVVFASLHLYQSNAFYTMLGIFLTTFLGAGLFAWLYVEWGYNLWISIAMHFFMNLSWEIFSISENALGNLSANWFRLVTIVLAIGTTIILKKRKGLGLAITKKTLFVK
ncbi:MAG: CPBP family intramembrane metalloprotease [Chlorobi bacterium]|nr:CPBP family intramembrane metalloprotease [Chlorobiota bacterium]